MKHFTISCDEEVYDWLQAHPEVNKSGLFQRVAKHMIRTGKTVVSEEEVDIILVAGGAQ